MIAICSALDVEYEALCKAFNAKSQNTIPALTGKWGIGKGNHTAVLLIRSEVGKASAKQHTDYFLKSCPDISLVISCGIAGALNPAMRIGDILCGDNIKDYPDKEHPLLLGESMQREAHRLRDVLLSGPRRNKAAPCQKGVGVSSDVMVDNPELRDELLTARCCPFFGLSAGLWKTWLTGCRRYCEQMGREKYTGRPFFLFRIPDTIDVYRNYK